MKTKNLINYNRATIQEFYEQGIISQAQYEAYDFAWSNVSYRYSNIPYTWKNLVQDARNEFWKIYNILPAKLQKNLRSVIPGNPYKSP